MKRTKIRYGILDDFGEVIRWSWDKPSDLYKFIIDRVPVKPAVDWSNFEPALL
jgi:hypothetical protein